jgi:2-polyprenyl-6-methoxyphenol hydroxylase-like FAD-dependent oxidoreductase
MEKSSFTTTEPLTVLIVGAGIGGLSAAIFLRRQGHKVLVSTDSTLCFRSVNAVKIFERSRFSAEVGAAIHVAPNCQRLLTRLGLSTADHGGTPLESVSHILFMCFIRSVNFTLTFIFLGSLLFMHTQGRELPRCP